MCVSPMDHDTSPSTAASSALAAVAVGSGVLVASSSDGDGGTPPRPDVRVVKLAALAARGYALHHVRLLHCVASAPFLQCALASVVEVARRYDLQYRMELANQGMFFDDEEVGDGHEPRAIGVPRRACCCVVCRA
jgi:hypothetical protein